MDLITLQIGNIFTFFKSFIYIFCTGLYSVASGVKVRFKPTEEVIAKTTTPFDVVNGLHDCSRDCNDQTDDEYEKTNKP